jgi:hypothetical protein
MFIQTFVVLSSQEYHIQRNYLNSIDTFNLLYRHSGTLLFILTGHLYLQWHYFSISFPSQLDFHSLKKKKGIIYQYVIHKELFQSSEHRIPVLPVG